MRDARIQQSLDACCRVGNWNVEQSLGTWYHSESWIAEYEMGACYHTGSWAASLRPIVEAYLVVAAEMGQVLPGFERPVRQRPAVGYVLDAAVHRSLVESP